jgi:hypothetical protein
MLKNFAKVPRRLFSKEVKSAAANTEQALLN